MPGPKSPPKSKGEESVVPNSQNLTMPGPKSPPKSKGEKSVVLCLHLPSLLPPYLQCAEGTEHLMLGVRGHGPPWP